MTTGPHTFPSILKIIKSTDNGLPYISVGSGTGILEKFLCENNINVICVDPTKTKRDRYTKDKLVKQPDYTLVSVLMEERPELVGACNVMLIYPLPDYGFVDITAIVDLQPVNIVTVVDDGGGSGSFFYHKFLRRCGLNTHGKLKTSESIKQATGIPDNFIPFPTHKYTVLYGVKNVADREMWLAVLKRDCKVLGNVTHYSKILCNGEDKVCVGKEISQRKANICLALMYRIFAKLEGESYSDCCNEQMCGCGKVCEGLKKCGQCNIKYYCSRECQVKDWKFHKKNCLTKD